MTRTPIAIAEFDTYEEAHAYSLRNPDVTCKLRETGTTNIAEPQKILFNMVDRLGLQVSCMNEILQILCDCAAVNCVDEITVYNCSNKINAFHLSFNELKTTYYKLQKKNEQ